MRIWHASEGLPSDSITAIIQTRDGFLWIGTTAGLVRFDGVKFTDAKPDLSEKDNLTGVTALCEDSNGHLWIGTQQNGLFQLTGGKMLHYSRNQGLLSDNVTSLASDNHGGVWIGSHSGLSLWDGRKFEPFTKHDGLPDESVSGINVARSGTVWITTRVGMCRFIDGHIAPYDFQTESQGRSPEYLGAYEDQRGNLWAFGDTYLINLTEGKRFNYFRSSEPTSVRIWSLCEGRDGRLWIGTSGRGLFCFQDNRFQPVILGENRWPYDVRSICEDREGNLWLGTSGGGLAQLRVQSVFVLREEQGLPGSLPTTLALDADGHIYVGLERGGLWMGESGRFDPVGGSDGLELQNFISAVCVGHDRTVWAGTLGDGLYGLRNGRRIHYTTSDGLSDNSILAMCVEGGDAVWLSTRAGTIHRLDKDGIVRFDATQGLRGAPVTAMISAARGLWAGTQNGQILRETDGKFNLIETASVLENQPVVALFEGVQGRLWIGTTGGGMACIANGTLLHWGTNNGLPDMTIAGMVEDGAKNLWLATGAGIYRVSHDDIRNALNNPHAPLGCKLVYLAKTVPGSKTDLGGARALLAPDGYLWFATSEGMLNVDTRRAEIEPPPFPVYIESATINDGPPISLLQGPLWSSAITNHSFVAPVDLRSLEIHVTALSYVSPEEIQFRHKLEGADGNWVNDVGARSYQYSHLLRGDYHFHVAARLGDGPWTESSAPFSFTVPTPFYFKTWAIGLYVIAAISLVGGTVRIISHRRLRRRLAGLEQERALERERMRIARDMHDEMGSKLTKISFLSEHVQMDAESAGAVSDKIQSIAQTSRDLLKTMDEIVWVVNPHNDTLENLVAYLSHYAVEYFQNTSIECEMRLPHEIPHHPLSSEARHNLFLAFEETLNNVLKHSGATRVNVAMSFNAPEFELKVTDNGRGFDADKLFAVNGEVRGGRGGNGLKNMRQRLTAVGGKCLVTSRTGDGATITLLMRLDERHS